MLLLRARPMQRSRVLLHGPSVARCWSQSSEDRWSHLWSQATTAGVVAAAAVTGGISSAILCDDGRFDDGRLDGYIAYDKVRHGGNKLAEVRRRPALPGRPGEPTFTSDEVEEHDSTSSLWVTYMDGVYDVTKFLNLHPGGARFLETAAGGPVDAWWAHWHFHHCSASVGEFLAEYRIGRLSDWEEDEIKGVDLYENDPERDPTAQSAFFDRPYSSQAQHTAIKTSYLTPASAMYVRNHCPVPQGDPVKDDPAVVAKRTSIRFDVALRLLDGGRGLSGLEAAEVVTPGKKGVVDTADEENSAVVGALSMADLEERFGRKVVTSVLQCGGSRAREDLAIHRKSGFTGNNFESITCGMLGNVQWSGIPLAAVLRDIYDLGSDVDAASRVGEHAHVEFHGADGYFASIPLAHILDDTNDCLLATTMNNEPLPRDHGYPLRLLMPNVVGARNVKWLKRIVIRHDEGLGPWNNHYYNDKGLPLINKAFQSGHTIPLNSMIHDVHVRSQKKGSTATYEGDRVVEVCGIAFSGSSGEEIAAVEISTDQGETWRRAEINRGEVLKDDSSKAWHWIRWSATTPLPATVMIPRNGSAREPARTPPEGVVFPRLALPLVKAENYAHTSPPPPALDGAPQVWCRAFTEKGKVQPETSEWCGGYNYNGYHKVQIE